VDLSRLQELANQSPKNSELAHHIGNLQQNLDELFRAKENDVDVDTKRKIALFTNVEARAVVVCKDAKTIYQIPRTFYEQNV
ncbi:hypothetical protein, partial [Acinetobacter oleivorans]|uniref:hypothetical protein n=1 Tax=Acinetobacter oleivorans TaxID=1148157 RepID=UPI001D1827D0